MQLIIHPGTGTVLLAEDCLTLDIDMRDYEGLEQSAAEFFLVQRALNEGSPITVAKEI